MRTLLSSKPETSRAKRICAGFSLIELLAAIAVIAILATILIPAISRIRQSAQQAQGVSNVRQIVSGLLTYAAANSDELPYCYEENVSDYSIRLSGFLQQRTEVYSNNNVRSPIFKDPMASLDKGTLHYSAHPVLMPNPAGGVSRVKVSSIARPNETVLIMDGAQDPSNGAARAGAGGVTGIRLKYDSGGDINAPVPAGPNRDGGSGLSNIRWRMNNDTAAKFGFADGHVAILSIGELKNRNIWTD